MQSNTVRVTAGIAIVVVAVVLFVALRNDDSGKSDSPASTSVKAAPAKAQGEKSAKPVVPSIVVKNGEPVGGVEELTYNQGDRVVFTVSSDVGDEVHVHGYDLMKDVGAGHTVRFDFPADIAGIFEVELEGRAEQIAELRVNP